MAVIRFPLTALAAVLYAVGFVTRKVAIEAPAWIFAAIRLGWEDAAK